eukprot:1887035-Amphidinium_carterae.1
MLCKAPKAFTLSTNSTLNTQDRIASGGRLLARSSLSNGHIEERLRATSRESLEMWHQQTKSCCCWASCPWAL